MIGPVILTYMPQIIQNVKSTSIDLYFDVIYQFAASPIIENYLLLLLQELVDRVITVFKNI
jgi:hypothetical protein